MNHFLLFRKSDVSNYMTLLLFSDFLKCLLDKSIRTDDFAGYEAKLSCTVYTLATNNWELNFKYIIYHQRSQIPQK